MKDMTGARLASVLIACAWLAGCGSPAPQTGGMSADARERIAGAAEASGDDELAESMYAKASAQSPADTKLRLRYADTLLRASKIDPARDMLTQSLATASDPIEIRRALGALNVMSGQTGPAIVELDKVLAAQPDDPRALVDKAVALDLQGHHPEAQLLYQRARQAAPDDPVIANDLALSMALEGRVREARDLLMPFKDRDHVPERIKVTVRILSSAIGDTGQLRPAGSGAGPDYQLIRMAVAFARAERGREQVPNLPHAATQ